MSTQYHSRGKTLSRITLDEEKTLDALRRLPMVKLHSHLPGETRTKVFQELADTYKIQLPDGISDAGFQFDDLGQFVTQYVAAAAVFRSSADFRRMAVDFAEQCRDQGVLYAVATFSPAVHAAILDNDVPSSWTMPLDSLLAGFDEARRSTGVTVNVVVDITREAQGEANDGLFFNQPANPDAHRKSLEVAQANASRKGSHVVAFGLGGNEAAYPTEWFKEYFLAAGQSGLALWAHAGEAAGPESVKAALDELKVSHIDHGIHAVGDAALMQRLQREQILITVCPTSNTRLNEGVITYDNHPIWAMVEAGLNTTLDTDDAAMFATTLPNEYLQLMQRGLDVANVVELVQNGWKAAEGLAPEYRAAGVRAAEMWLAAFVADLAIPSATELFEQAFQDPQGPDYGLQLVI